MGTELHQIRPETAEALAARANELGISIETLLRRLLMESEPTPTPRMTAAEVDQLLDELSANGDNVLPLPAGFSREDIYFDHD